MLLVVVAAIGFPSFGLSKGWMEARAEKSWKKGRASGGWVRPGLLVVGHPRESPWSRWSFFGSIFGLYVGIVKHFWPSLAIIIISHH